MPKIKEWEFEEFPYGNITCQRIEFSIDDHSFFMFFTPVENDPEYLLEIENTTGFKLPEQSYDIKFDRCENFESSNFYARHNENFSHMSPLKMKRLGLAIIQIMDFHCDMKNAKLYLATAESSKHKSFYNSLVKKHKKMLHCDVLVNLGIEGLTYAIKTKKF